MDSKWHDHYVTIAAVWNFELIEQLGVHCWPEVIFLKISDLTIMSFNIFGTVKWYIFPCAKYNPIQFCDVDEIHADIKSMLKHS